MKIYSIHKFSIGNFSRDPRLFKNRNFDRTELIRSSRPQRVKNASIQKQPISWQKVQYKCRKLEGSQTKKRTGLII